MPHGSQGLFTQAGFNDPSQDESSQSHFGMGGPSSLQSQVLLGACNSCLSRSITFLTMKLLQALLNPLYSQPFAHYNAQPQNLQSPPQQNQGSPNQKLHYNG